MGVAILSNAPEKMPDKKDKVLKDIKDKERRSLLENADSRDPPLLNNTVNRNPAIRARGDGPNARNGPSPEVVNARIQKLLKEMEDIDKNQVVKLGDASIAAPFTSRLSSIMCSKFYFN